MEEFNGKSWDEWLREKLVNDMQKLQLKREKRHHLREEKKRLQVERCRKEEIANENRKEWLQKKVFKLEKERREKVAQTEFEKLKVRFGFSFHKAEVYKSSLYSYLPEVHLK